MLAEFLPPPLSVGGSHKTTRTALGLHPRNRRAMTSQEREALQQYSVQRMHESNVLIGREPKVKYNPNLKAHSLTTRLLTTRAGVLWKDNGLPLFKESMIQEHDRIGQSRDSKRKPKFAWLQHVGQDAQPQAQHDAQSRTSREKLMPKKHGGLTLDLEKLNRQNDELRNNPSERSSNKSMDVRSTSFMSFAADVIEPGRESQMSAKNHPSKIINDDMARVEEAMFEVRTQQKNDFLERLQMAKDPRYRKNRWNASTPGSPAQLAKSKKYNTDERNEMMEVHAKQEVDANIQNGGQTTISLPKVWAGANFESFEINPIRKRDSIPFNALRREKTIGIDWKISKNVDRLCNSGTLSKDLRPVTAGLEEYGTSQRMIRGRIVQPEDMNTLKVLPIKLDGLLPVQMARKVSRELKAQDDAMGTDEMATSTILSSDRLGDWSSMGSNMNDFGADSAPPTGKEVKSADSGSRTKSIKFAHSDTYETYDYDQGSDFDI